MPAGHWKATGQILGKFMTKNPTKNLEITYPPFDLQAPGDQRGGYMISRFLVAFLVMNFPRIRPVVFQLPVIINTVPQIKVRAGRGHGRAVWFTPTAHHKKTCREDKTGHWKATGRILGKFMTKNATKNLEIMYPPFDLHAPGDQGGGHDLQIWSRFWS